MERTALTQDTLVAALPETAETVSLPGLGAPAEIFRDEYGIPHVRASSIGDAFFAQGFATAQDRLWQMDYDRHRAYGRWAEYIGPSGVDQDRYMRRLRLGASARADYEAVSQSTRSMLDAYAAGVSAFIDTTRTLPVEYGILGVTPEAWRPWDGLAIFKVRHIFMGVFEAKLWRARLAVLLGPERVASLFPGYANGQLVVLPIGATYDGLPDEGLEALAAAASQLGWLAGTEAGSNNWALSGSRTATGKPLLAGDPHRPPEIPNVYYQNHLSCPEFDVVGLSFPGIPGFPHFGHNEHVAWCVTHANADYQDLYIERLRDGDPPQYEFKGEWWPAETHEETISVKGGDDVVEKVTVTHHGPIVAGDPTQGHGIALRYTATTGPVKGADALLSMLSATSAMELDESMRSWVDPANSFVFADVDGNIGYLTRGQVPVRLAENAWAPVPGWTGEHEWSGFIPFEEMPRSLNPDAGYIVTANNRITGPEYPHYVGFDFTPGFRARRITERLKDLDSAATVEDMAAVHADRVSLPAQAYLRVISRLRLSDGSLEEARAQLLQWDGSMDRDAVAPTILSAFQDRLVRRVVESLLGPLAVEALEGTGRGGPAHVARLRTRVPLMIEAGDRSLLPEGAEWDTLILQALDEAVSWLRLELGEDMDSWRWGRLHRTKIHHPLGVTYPELAHLLDPPAVEAGGDGDTPQAGGYSMSQPCVLTLTSVARYVFDLADWGNSAWIVPLGASGHPGSPHFADQASTWSDVRIVPMLYSWSRIESGAESRQELIPAGG